MRAINKKSLMIIVLCVGMIAAETSARLKKDDKDITTRNLRVLPHNISHDELISIMRNISKSLGVKCGTCHVEIPGKKTPEGHPMMDFASDDKEEKRVARKMMRMTEDINERIDDIGDHKFEKVQCVTCHRGKTKPSATLDAAFQDMMK